MISIDEKNIIDIFSNTLLAKEIPPIAAKILGLFYVSDKKYFTFNEIGEHLQITKGAVSKALSLLQNDLKVIDYIYKGKGKRKRHFYLDIQGSIEYIKRFIELYKRQNEIYKTTLKVRGQYNIEVNQFLKKIIRFNEAIISSLEKQFKISFLENGNKGIYNK